MVYLGHFLKKQSSKRIGKNKRREADINKIIDALADWRLTPFENEGSVRSGIRSALCIGGESWSKADGYAADLIAAALEYMGVERPSWDQGQRQYTLGDGICYRCHGSISEEMQGGTNGATKFCSGHCAKSFLLKREDWSLREADRFRLRAYTAMRRDSNPVVCCRTCTKPFKPIYEGGRFCSDRCSRAAEIQKTCCQCGSDYVARHGKSKYCSDACNLKFNRNRRRVAAGGIIIGIGQPVSCVECGCKYPKKSSLSKYCSSRCNQTAKAKRLAAADTADVIAFKLIWESQTKPSNVIYLTAEVFDSWFKVAA